MINFAWLCEVRGLIHAKSTGSPTYGGAYMAVYFEDFKALAIRRDGSWVLINKAFPLNYRGGAYGMAQSLWV